MKGLLAIGCVVGCYSPTAQPGSPCDKSPCPEPLICSSISSTCVSPGSVSDASIADTPSIDARPIDAPPNVGCTVMGFDTCNDGIDQDCVGGDAICVGNDTAGGAIDATAGGTFAVDLLLARDDVSNADCNGDGGRDVFYTISIQSPQVYYFDTFGSDHDTSVRVFPGVSCGLVSAGMTPACDDDSCGSSASQLAFGLPPGTSCVVIDQNSAATTGGLTLHVVPGGLIGTPLGGGMQTNTGDTCASANSSQPTFDCDGGNSIAKDIAYYFKVCPNQTLQLDATTCAAPTMFDTVLYVHLVGVTDDLACDDDSTCVSSNVSSTLSGVPISGPGLVWLVVDGFGDTDCGPYTLLTTLN